MEREYYSLKEVIFGLNDHYQLQKKNLEQLESMCEFDPKKVLDFHIYESQHGEVRPTLMAYYVPNESKIQKLVNDFKKKNNLYYYGGNLALLLTDNHYYYFNSKSPYPVWVNHKYNEDGSFFHQAESVLNSDFSKGITLPSIYLGESGINAATLDINTRIIHFCGVLGGGSLVDSSNIWYRPEYNELSFSTWSKCIDNQYIEDVLDIKVPARSLSPYHIRSIELSETLKKPIVFEKTALYGKVVFDIAENEKEVVLSKKIGTSQVRA